MIFGKRKKIVMVVDDEYGIRETSDAILESWGFNVVTAMNGKEAHDKAKDIKPDLIILDVNIPEINGFDLCRILKNDPQTKDVIIILATGLGKTKEVDKGFQCGADDYVIKPIDWDRLKAKVSKFVKIKN